MIIVDASALVDDGPHGQAARSALRRDSSWAAPDHLSAEVFSAIRGRYLAGRLPAERARAVVGALAEERAYIPVETRLLLGRMWALRDRFSGYDSAYVAAAERLGCALVTADVRLARAAKDLCEVWTATP
jgi:predicted nucleic acid-binding protein